MRSCGSILLGVDRVEDLGTRHQNGEHAGPEHDPTDLSMKLIEISLAALCGAQSERVDDENGFKSRLDDKGAFDHAQHVKIEANAGPTLDLRHFALTEMVKCKLIRQQRVEI